MKRRTIRRDPVTHDVALAVLRRDAGCVAVTLGEPPADCRGRLTLDHVKDQPRMGVRAPSDEAHLVSLCEWHHIWSGWATSHRPELRDYLRGCAFCNTPERAGPCFGGDRCMAGSVMP